MESQLDNITLPPDWWKNTSSGTALQLGPVVSPPHDPLIQVMEILQRLPEDHRTRLIDAIAVYYGYILDDNE